MDFNNKDLVKSLTSLIDDTLAEIDEIKKSKFAATEIKIEGPGAGIDGKPVNGDLHAKKEEKEEEEDDKIHIDIASHNEDEDEDKKKDMKKKEDEEKESKEHEEKESKKEEDKEEMKEMKKSISASEELMKSYVESRFSAFEERLAKMAATLETIANAPVSRKGVPAGVTALAKSIEEYAPLNKSQVAEKLFELKKSGTNVDSSDIFRVETTQDSNELRQIANKYGVK